MKPIIVIVVLVSVGLQAQESQTLGVFGISLTTQQGIRITRVVAGGPAESAGLAVGDVIVSINGRPVKQATEEAELHSSRPPGAVLRVAYMRNNKKAEVDVALGEKPLAAATNKAVPAATNKAVPAATAVLQHITLWGVTMGQPVPNLPLCSRSDSDWGTCLFYNSGNSPNLYNVPYSHASIMLYVGDDGLVYSIGGEVSESQCYAVQQALENKLGKVQPTVRQWQNGFGATWPSEEWEWQAADGAVVFFSYHMSNDRKGCFLSAESGESRRQNQPPPVVQP